MITNLRVKPKKFRVKGKKPLGATINWGDSQAAITKFTVLRPARGVKVKGRCLKPSKKRHGKRCTRFVALGSFTHTDVQGANLIHFTGGVRGRKLKPGSYRLRAVPVLGTLTGKAVTASFRVIK